MKIFSVTEHNIRRKRGGKTGILQEKRFTINPKTVLGSSPREYVVSMCNPSYDT